MKGINEFEYVIYIRKVKLFNLLEEVPKKFTLKM